MRFIAQACLVQLRERVLPFLCNLRQFRVGAHFVRYRGGDTNDQSYGRRFITCTGLNDFGRGLKSSSIERMFSPFSRMGLAFHYHQSVVTNPFSRALSRVMTIPRAAIRGNLRTFVPYYGLFVDGNVFRVNFSDFFMTFRRYTRVLESANAAFGLRRARAYVRRLVRGVGDFRIFQQRSVFIVGVRFRVHFLVAGNVEAAARLRADAPINEVIRLVREGVTFAQGDRARHAVARRFGAGLFTAQATSVFFLCLPMGLHCLFRVRFANRCRCVDGPNVRFRHFYVKSVRLNKGVRLLPCPTNVIRRYGVDHGRDQGSHFLDHVSGHVRWEGVFVVSGNIRHRMTFRPILVTHTNCFPRIVGHRHVNQANARVRIFCARVSEVNAYLGNHD